MFSLLRRKNFNTKIGRRQPSLKKPLLEMLEDRQLLSSFQGLGDLPGGGFYSEATGVSADGSVVIGDSNSASSAPGYGREAFRWVNGVMTGLGDLPGGDFYSFAGYFGAVSANGSVVVGNSIYDPRPNAQQAFRWQNGVMTALGFLPGHDLSIASGVTPDGLIVVGTSNFYTGGGDEAFRWVNGVMTALGHIPGGVRANAFAVSADGSIIVGRDNKGTPGDTEAFRWQNGVMTGLGDLPGGISQSEARGISADGSTIVGYSISSLGFEAFRWQSGVMTGLGLLPGGGSTTFANAVTSDGSVIVGGTGFDTGGLAFIWDATHGMRNLRSVLISDFGLNLTGWTLNEAIGITPDGQTIVGRGTNPLGQTEGWIARLATTNQQVTAGQTLTGNLWLNLANTDDIGTYFDVQVEALDQNGVVFATGMLDRFRPVRVASSAQSVTLTASRTVTFSSSDNFSLRVSTRIDEGPGHTSGRLQVQFDAVTRNSTLGINFGSGNRTYYLHENPLENNGIMNTTDNTGDTTVNLITKLASKNGGNPWVTMGVWTGTVGNPSAAPGPGPTDNGDTDLDPLISSLVEVMRTAALDSPEALNQGDRLGMHPLDSDAKETAAESIALDPSAAESTGMPLSTHRLSAAASVLDRLFGEREDSLFFDSLVDDRSLGWLS